MVQEAAVLAVDTGAGDQMICAYFAADQELSAKSFADMRQKVCRAI